jgi:hypothetical protein
MPSAPSPDRDTISTRFTALGDEDKAYVQLLLENPAQDDNVIEALRRHLDRAASASFLNSLKLENFGRWIGDVAPPRLQIRLMEAAKSSQHPAYAAFRAGLDMSKGLLKAFPPTQI